MQFHGFSAIGYAYLLYPIYILAVYPGVAYIVACSIPGGIDG
jgi:hypothetical protein